MQIQEFKGISWVGIVAFQMAGVMRRMLPDLPWISAFPQLNVRLYVERDGKPGVWFLSVDATHPLAVWAGRVPGSKPCATLCGWIETVCQTVCLGLNRVPNRVPNRMPG